jgi:hypothetical protein
MDFQVPENMQIIILIITQYSKGRAVDRVAS